MPPYNSVTDSDWYRRYGRFLENSSASPDEGGLADLQTPARSLRDLSSLAQYGVAIAVIPNQTSQDTITIHCNGICVVGGRRESFTLVPELSCKRAVDLGNPGELEAAYIELVDLLALALAKQDASLAKSKIKVSSPLRLYVGHVEANPAPVGKLVLQLIDDPLQNVTTEVRDRVVMAHRKLATILPRVALDRGIYCRHSPDVTPSAHTPFQDRIRKLQALLPDAVTFGIDRELQRIAFGYGHASAEHKTHAKLPATFADLPTLDASGDCLPIDTLVASDPVYARRFQEGFSGADPHIRYRFYKHALSKPNPYFTDPLADRIIDEHWIIRHQEGYRRRAKTPEARQDDSVWRNFLEHALSDSPDGHALGRSLNAIHETELNVLCALFGSDKGRPAWWPVPAPFPWRPHNYTKVYAELFKDLRWRAQTIFECGIGSNDHNIPSNMGSNGRPGASLRVWKSFFPHARILGADIDRGVLFNEPGIETQYVDQTDPKSIEAMWRDLKLKGRVDVIFDDGLHTYQAGTSLLLGCWNYLKPGGHYIIEDVPAKDVTEYRYFLAKHSSGFLKGSTYSIRYLPRDSQRGDRSDDNRLIIIRKSSDGTAP